MTSANREGLSDRIFNGVSLAIMLIIAVVILYPLYFIVVASFSDPNIVNRGGVLLFPTTIYLDGYRRIFGYAPLWRSYANSIFYTAVGTLINIIVTIPAGYALSRKDLYGKGVLMFLLTFTMFFSGGMIPLYLMVSRLRMLDTVWALVLPCAASSMNVIITRTYFQSNIPAELLDAARIDGCNDFKFLLRIVLPVSGAIVSVMLLFYGVRHWNSFFDALIYLHSDQKYPLQIILRNLLIVNQQGGGGLIDDPLSMAVRQRLAEQMKHGIIIVSSLPLIMVYPFVQKNLTKGVMIGAIKG